jgi:hypothetical protein
VYIRGEKRYKEAISLYQKASKDQDGFLYGDKKQRFPGK